MIQFWILFITLVLVGCGQDRPITNITNESTPATAGNEAPTSFSFTGVFRFANDSQIEIVQTVDGELNIVTTGQLMQSINPKNGSIGVHPVLSRVNEEVHNGVAFYVLNVNYTAGNDLEQDVSGSNITGSKQTTFKLYMSDERTLNIIIKIYNNSINNNPDKVVAERKFVSL